MKKPVEIIKGITKPKNGAETAQKKEKLSTKRMLTIGGCAVLIALAVWANMTLSSSKNYSQDEVQASPEFEGDAATAEPVAAGDEAAAQTEEDDYFAVFRENRDATRDKELAYLNEIVADENTDSEILARAQDQRLALIDAMEKEMTIEGLLMAKDFTGVAVTVKEGSVNVVVDRESLTDTEVAQILDIAMSETGEPADNIKVMNLN